MTTGGSVSGERSLRRVFSRAAAGWIVSLGVALIAGFAQARSTTDRHIDSNDGPATEVVVHGRIGPPLWKVSGTAGDVWILPYPDVLPVWTGVWSPKLEGLLDRVDLILTEPNLHIRSSLEERDRPWLPKGRTLTDVVDPALFARVVQTAHDAGLSSADLTDIYRARPGVAGGWLWEKVEKTRDQVTYNNPGIVARQLAPGRRMTPLPYLDMTAADRAWHRSPPTSQTLCLASFLDRLDYETKTSDFIYKAWRRNDEQAALSAYVPHDLSSCLLVSQAGRDLFRKIRFEMVEAVQKNLNRRGTTLLIISYYNWWGEDGVLARLKADGLPVSRAEP